MNLYLLVCQRSEWLDKKFKKKYGPRKGWGVPSFLFQTPKYVKTHPAFLLSGFRPIFWKIIPHASYGLHLVKIMKGCAKAISHWIVGVSKTTGCGIYWRSYGVVRHNPRPPFTTVHQYNTHLSHLSFREIFCNKINFPTVSIVWDYWPAFPYYSVLRSCTWSPGAPIISWPPSYYCSPPCWLFWVDVLPLTPERWLLWFRP